MCESHREKIQQLWDRLQVPQEEREAFNEHMVTSKKRNLEAVRIHTELRLLFFFCYLKLSVVMGVVAAVCLFFWLTFYVYFSVASRSSAFGGAQTAKHP